MNTRWIPALLKGEEKQSHINAIKASTTLTNQFLLILDQLDMELDRLETNPDKMSNDWFAKQVFINGQKKVLREMRELFNFKG